MLKNNIFVPNFFGDLVELTSVKFFFIFCPNNSGTTVLSQYLAGQIDAYLPPYGNYEGQMAPIVKQMMRSRPWDEDSKFDWNYIRGCWERLAAERMFIEASPPNLIRTDDIKIVFGRDSSALTSICNPYQQIASAFRKNAHNPQKTAQFWVRKAQKLIQIRQSYPYFPVISYEEFVINPQIVNERLGIPFKEVAISGKKGSDISGIKSGYNRGIGFLKPDEVTAISVVLKEASDVMEYFGYVLNGPEILDIAQERDPNEFRIGLKRREEWDRRQSASRSD